MASSRSRTSKRNSAPAPRADPKAGAAGAAAPVAPDRPAPDGAAPAKPRLVVTALADRRRRLGRDFGRAETELDPEAIGEDGFRALVFDPVLKVELVVRSGERLRITSFPPSEDVQAQLDALAAEDSGDA